MITFRFVLVTSLLLAVVTSTLSQFTRPNKNDELVWVSTAMMAEGLLLYASDHDDRMVPWDKGSASWGPPELAWQAIAVSYFRSSECVIHPKRPKPYGSYAWSHRWQYFAVPPRAVTADGPPRFAGNYTVSYAPLGLNNTLFDGWAGLMVGLEGTSSGNKSAPSLTLSEIEHSNEVVLVGEAQDQAYWWWTGINPMYGCTRWNPWQASVYGSQWTYNGPGANYMPIDGRTGVGTNCQIANGGTTFATVDGAIVREDFRTQTLQRVQRQDGTTVLKRFWPRAY